ncbi:ABC transporter ATP-binding protein [Oenococcus sp.]|uniref:ABC transporter ATP-binding protein n=1 Tax=Oenococcus sp. TaxID=1979414 RepID=UPI0039E9D31B
MVEKHLTYSLWNNLRWWWGIMRQERPWIKWTLVGYICLTAIVSVISVIIPAWLVSLLASRAHFANYATVALAMAAALAGTVVAQNLCLSYGRDLSGAVRSRVLLQMHSRVLSVPYQQLIEPSTEKLYHEASTNGTSWTMAGAQAIFFGLEGALADSITLLIFVLTLSAFTPWLFVLVLLAAVASYFALQWFRDWYDKHKNIWAADEKQQDYLERTGYASENGKDVRLYHVQSWYHAHLDKLIHDRMQWQRRSSRREMVSRMIGEMAGLVRDAAAYSYLIAAVLAKTLTLGQFTLLFSVTNQFVTLTNQLLEDMHILQKASIDLQDVRRFLDTSKEKNLPPLSAAMAKQLAKRPVTIIFDHVNFTYPEAVKETLQDVSFTMHAGEKLALVGVNGAGKSTIVKLMIGLFTPGSGRITINGLNAAMIPLQDRYDLFAPVFQETTLIAASVANNIALTSTPDSARVQTALATAGLTEKIASLPNGVETPMTRNIDDQGVEFSGGQAQKLMLARAVYKNAPVLVLDEPTAALDALAENEVYESFAGLVRGKSAIFISHRLASTRFCDRIIFLADGKITTQGTHEELMAQGGSYAEMYRVQSKYYQKNLKSGDDHD